jgi:glutamine synthetase
MPETAGKVLALVRDRGILAVDLRFMATTGCWQHITIPSQALDEAVFREGVDCRRDFPGWAAIRDYDLRIVPIPSTAFIDPFYKHATLTILCELVDPLIREPYVRDPRNVARKSVRYLNEAGG